MVVQLVFLFFAVTGILYLFDGINTIRKQQSHISIGTVFRKIRHDFSGRLAKIHGIFNSAIGIFCIFWFLLLFVTNVDDDWNWLLLGCSIAQSLVFLSFLLMFSLKSMANSKEKRKVYLDKQKR